MRVALFFDGKNHMKALHRSTRDRWLDHGALARWTVEKVGGERLVAAWYYTGVPSAQDADADRHALSDLLEEIERRPGFFVKRFDRRAAARDCPHCGEIIAYTEEKLVDTTLVADVITLAVRDAFDVAVVFSGDVDLVPALDAVHALGKQVWVATFGAQGLSRALARAAWGQLDLLEDLEAFSYGDLTEEAPASPGGEADGVRLDEVVHRELRRAELHFGSGGGFVGTHYFVHRWKGRDLPEAPELRRQSLKRLVELGRAETYEADGKSALRTLPPVDEPAPGPWSE